ncbi:MAG TPA: phenylalanine--tRNA ligase subunit beta [Blastocatellia bacterium]|jgi:phenylalanyl-tRNA synthetase beta chain|nr:phenylalanine--tRNA ligase subunit beta [Blastocatellia bacterium]
MKINYNWVKELVDIDLPPRDLAEKLTMAGLAVDSVESYGDDAVLEFDLTSNRPDCLSHLGIAREAAAVLWKTGGKTARTPEAKIIEAKTRTSDVTSVEILAPALCPRYTARVIRGVKIGPSPDWLVKRLESVGQRSVNNVADITNFVMLEMGQPLHAFDLHQLRGERIVVRTAAGGEKITTLDGEKRDLTPEMLVIADAERPVAIAGIKGGEDSGITEKTADVLLEAAYFAPAQTRATSKALGLSTEASYRFERGTDPEIVAKASDRAAALIADIAGGEVLSGLVDVYPTKAARGLHSWIEFRRSRYTVLTGLQIELGEAEGILRSLGFIVEADVENDRLRARAPSWRVDVSIEEDLIEEVARIAGYDKLKNTLPGAAGAGAYLPGEDARRAARLTLTALGYNEAVSFSFVNGETDEMLSEAGVDARLALLNPIDETQAHMRVTLLGGLLDSLERNFNHGARNVRLFEIGKCFMDDVGERPLETERLGIVATGARNEDDWQSSASSNGGGNIDFYDVKGAIESVVEAVGLPALEFEPDDSRDFLQPGRSAKVRLGDEVIGVMGQLHPRLAARYKFKQPVFVADLNLRMMLLAERTKVRYHPLPKFPTVVRDLALLIDTSVQFAGVERAIIELKIPELVGVKLFDLYAGKELPTGKHSIALSLRFRASNRTLTVEEVNAAHDRVIKMLKREFGAEVR